MAFEIPMDLIEQTQILVRREANLSSYNPDDTSLPTLPSPEDAIAELDPSPPDLRCKHCKGRLLRGLQSVICILCGRERSSELPPEPINFKNTIGCRWLLESLDLDGSEMVGLSTDAKESKRGQSSLDEFPLLDLLNLEIRWPSVSEKFDNGLSHESHDRSKSLSKLAGVDLDNFFTEGKRDTSGHSFIEPTAMRKQNETPLSNTFQDHGNNLSLFGIVQPSETTKMSTDDSFSGWDANFQSTSSATLRENPESVDHFVGSTVDISAQMDAVFGTSLASIDGKAENNKISSSSTSTGKFENDLWSNFNTGIVAQSDLDTGTADFREIDSFDTWNDFTSLTSTQNASNTHQKQTDDTAVPSTKETSEIDLFSLPPTSKDIAPDRFSLPDPLGAISISLRSTELGNMQLEASAPDSTSKKIAKEGENSEGVVKGVDNISTAKSNSEDVQMLMSQMHDLFFMLENSLSIPPK